jgi:thiosulfate/3-mercaptopyruvate sulfurtransferase
VARDAPAARQGRVAPHVRDGVLAGIGQVRSPAPGVRLVDARSAAAFDAPGGAAAVRGGHIPDAVCLPAAARMDSLSRYQPADSLRARFTRAGIAPGERLVVYCGIGRSACPVYVAARMLGHEVRLYDGSFEEWSRREDVPVEIGAKK